MKIQYCSDLHLEFTSNSKWIKENPIKPVGEILLVAGDTYYLGENFQKHEWFDYASDHWEQVFLIPGNHEFYSGFDANICLETDVEIKIRDNVYLINNTVREIGNVRYVFSTMWSKVEREIGAIFGGLNDFRLIQVNNRKLNIETYNQLFDVSWNFLQSEINRKTSLHKIFVTHHLPSEQCNLPKYKRSILNEAFCIDKTEDILNSDIDAWIFGHSHGNIDNFKIGSTQMLTNQLGYIEANEHLHFKGDTYFELD